MSYVGFPSADQVSDKGYILYGEPGGQIKSLAIPVLLDYLREKLDISPDKTAFGEWFAYYNFFNYPVEWGMNIGNFRKSNDIPALISYVNYYENNEIHSCVVLISLEKAGVRYENETAEFHDYYTKYFYLGRDWYVNKTKDGMLRNMQQVATLSPSKIFPSFDDAVYDIFTSSEAILTKEG